MEVSIEQLKEIQRKAYAQQHAKYLYKAQIKTADIIAYTDIRKESEIMQYNKVFNIELLQEV